MSRRHHHHTIQPYDYDRFGDPTRERNEQTRAIEYQDDSLSSINSDEDSYLHHAHGSKEKKPSYFNKSEPSIRPKNDKNNEEFYQKSAKNHNNSTSESSSTIERLGRLENMLEELLKRNTQSNPEKSISEKSKEGQYSLDPRRHDFTTSMWINKIQEISFQNKWTEKDTIQYMGTQMSGIVKAWYKSLSTHDLTWPEWKIQITKIFPDNTDFITTLKRLVTRLKQSDETITTYYFSKMYLIEACKITGEDAVSCLIDGLNNQVIQEQAKARNFLTPESLYSQFLMLLSDYTVDYSPSPPSTDTASHNWYYQEPEEGNVVEVEEPTEEFVAYENEPRSEEFDYRNQNLEENKSHSGPKRPGTVHSRLDKRFIRPTPFKKYNNRVPLAAKVCTICDKRGHLAKYCRNADKMFFSKFPNQRKGCFYKDCQINNHKLSALIDTGCTTVAIKEHDARRMKLQIKSVSSYLQAYGGDVIKILGKVDVRVQVDSVKARVRAVVVPNHVQEVSVIIGEEFLRQKNMSLIVKNSTLKISEN